MDRNTMSTPAENRVVFMDGVIHYAYVVSIVKEEHGIAGHIPAYNMFFSAKTEEEAIEKAIAMVDSFFKYWIVVAKDKSELTKELMRFGFRGKTVNTLRDFLD